MRTIWMTTRILTQAMYNPYKEQMSDLMQESTNRRSISKTATILGLRGSESSEIDCMWEDGASRRLDTSSLGYTIQENSLSYPLI